MRDRITLNGLWDWSIPGGCVEQKIVPSSYRCVGEAAFEKTIALTFPASERLFLCFEGIAFEGYPSLNGTWLERMLPFVPYEFDITSLIRRGENRLRVEVKDILATYGPVIGWECYAGLIRDVYLERRSGAHVADYQWTTHMSDDYRTAACDLEVWLDAAGGATGSYELALRLAHEGRPAYAGTQEIALAEGRSAVSFHFQVVDPLLWSPEAPHLYDLSVSLQKDGQAVDGIGQQVGFREFAIRGTRFYLNGREIILRGVCRHEIWGEEQGHTLTREQTEQDMRLIKELGANYVRLVHYPHAKYAIELADRLGLMVSGEPLSWQTDFGDERIAEATLEALRRLVLRDRNNPSVIFWLAWNECPFRGDYLARARALCRELDPSRPVSAANNQPLVQAKEVFGQAGLDFYTMHPYGSLPNSVNGGSIEEILTVLDDKPVVFTEWGGWFMQNNPGLTELFGETFMRFARRRSPQPNLAGFSFWEWADMPEPVRQPPACRGGILIEGLVDLYRNKRPLYDTMAGIFAALDRPPAREWVPRVVMSTLPASEGSEYEPIDLRPLIDCEAQAALWERAMARALEERTPLVKSLRGPLLPEPLTRIGAMPVRIAAGRPLALDSDGPRVAIPIGRAAATLLFFGQVALCGGYPLGGRYGEEAARYTLLYEDGSRDEIRLRNGMEMASAGTIYLHSRINPLASRTQRVLHLQMDPDWKEAYQINCCAFPAAQAKVLSQVLFELLSPGCVPLLYGITLERV